jgi:hypothetical protein
MHVFGRPDGMRDLVDGRIPDAWANGPLLTSAAYPDVLVARAVSPDGRSLELVLQAGAGAVRTTLELGRLVPGQSYDVTGAAAGSVTADDRGVALVEVDLEGRVEVTVRPS